MASYRIEWKRSAVKELKRLPVEVIARIVKAVEGLSANPFPAGLVKLAGALTTYRIRIGDYRVVYSVDESVLVVEIVRVRHRKDVYR
jgi:mRNA interferase RelE/StbE